MAVAVALQGGFPHGVSCASASGRVRFRVQLTFSGSYSTGGDTVNLAGLVPGVGKAPPLKVDINGQSGAEYRWVPGTTMSNGKVKVMVETTVATNTLLSEHTAVSYVAGVTGDTVYADVECELYKAA